jgi:uncharacterized protein YcgI (DUF1989 family)
MGDISSVGMHSIQQVTVPARGGASVPVREGQILRVIDLEGTQVADLVAVTQADRHEYLDTARTCSMLNRIYFRQGDRLFTNRRRPILEVVRDDVGAHDMQMAACDPRRYEIDFGATGHANCLANLTQALAAREFSWWEVPNPVNVFQSTPVQADGSFVQLPAQSRAGDCVEFRALMDVLVAVSACPQDYVPINGLRPTPIGLEVLEASTP